MHLNGPWSRERVDDYPAKAVIPLGIGCVSNGGWPVVASRWFLHREGVLWCAGAQGPGGASPQAANRGGAGDTKRDE